MRALSLYQPWATLISSGAKTIETRSWPIPGNYRGPLAIHASKRWTAEEQATLHNPRFRAALLVAAQETYWDGRDLPLGKVVAVAHVRDCVRMDQAFERKYASLLTPWEREFGFFAPGRFAWVLGNIVPIEPVPARGAQGVWEWDYPDMKIEARLDIIEDGPTPEESARKREAVLRMLAPKGTPLHLASCPRVEGWGPGESVVSPSRCTCGVHEMSEFIRAQQSALREGETDRITFGLPAPRPTRPRPVQTAPTLPGMGDDPVG